MTELPFHNLYYVILTIHVGWQINIKWLQTLDKLSCILAVRGGFLIFFLEWIKFFYFSRKGLLKVYGKRLVEGLRKIAKTKKNQNGFLKTQNKRMHLIVRWRIILYTSIPYRGKFSVGKISYLCFRNLLLGFKNLRFKINIFTQRCFTCLI